MNQNDEKTCVTWCEDNITLIEDAEFCSWKQPYLKNKMLRMIEPYRKRKRSLTIG